MSEELSIIWWRDIPAQVVGGRGRKRSKLVLDDRFQLAIDRAAMVAGLTGTDEYVEQWRRSIETAQPDRSSVEAWVEHLETSYTPERVDQLVRNGGCETPPAAAFVDEEP